MNGKIDGRRPRRSNEGNGMMIYVKDSTKLPTYGEVKRLAEDLKWNEEMVIGPPTTYYSNLRIWKCNFDDDDW